MAGSAPRLLILGLGAGLVVWAYLEGARSQRPGVRAASAATDQVERPANAGSAPRVAPGIVPRAEPVRERGADYAADYGDFVEWLATFRAGDDSSLPALRAAAARLERLHERADAPVVSEYYATLSSEERTRGLEDYRHFAELWQAVQSADPAEWPRQRAARLNELRAFIASSAARADFVPAGRALSLAAQIEVRALEGGMDVLEREDWSELAERDAREALAIFERAGMETPRLEPLWVLAKLSALAGEERLAEELYEELLETAEVCRVDDYRERALLGLLLGARAHADLPRVDRLLGELARFRDPADCWPLAREQAGRLLHDDQPQHAAEFLLRVRPLDPLERRSWTHMLALTRLRQGDVRGARALIDRLAVGEQDAELDAELLVARARVLLSEGQARAVLGELTPERLAQFDPREARFAHTLLGEARLELGQSTAALEELAAARRIARTWELRLEEQRALEGTAATIFGEWQGLHTASLEARALCLEGRELEAALAIERAQSRHWRGAGTPADLAAWAAPYEHGLVTWIFGADKGLAVHVDRTGHATALEIDRPRRELTRAVRRLREALIGGDEVRAARLSAELATTLLPPALLDELELGAQEERLLCIAHGAVELLPFEALVWAGRSLDERATCLVLPELRDLRPGPAPPAEFAWTLLGDPLAPDGRVLLPAAVAELDEVQKLWPETRRLTADAFTRSALLEALGEGAAMHLATHLVNDAECDASRFSAVGLLLSGGEVLCAAELAECAVVAPLIVLSACDTAGGRFIDARGRQGIARALLDGGARDLLVTLWPVTDDAARAFTPRFHAALRAGLVPSRAARRARAELAQGATPAADWAAFRIAGRD